MRFSYVTAGTAKRNLFWVVVIVSVVTFHGCIGLNWMEAQDEQDRMNPEQFAP